MNEPEDQPPSELSDESQAEHLPSGPTRRALLDVNVLIALLDMRHPAHALVMGWYGAHTGGTALCPTVEAGAVRIMANPAYSQNKSAFGLQALLARMARMRQVADNMHYWSEEVFVSDTDALDHSKILGPRQLTDVALLALAHKKGAMLATLDRNIPRAAVRGATQASLLVL